MFAKIKPSEALQAPYIKMDVVVSHSLKKTKKETKYVIAPSGKKISTYIVNQIFGSDLITQTEGLNINWLMPTLKEALELSVYEKESFVYIHKFDEKIYLECIKKSEIHDLVQHFDKVISGTIIQDYDGLDDKEYLLKRYIKLENGKSFIKMKTFAVENKGNKEEEIEIPIEKFNKEVGTDYISNYVLPYEVLINIDLGKKFFKDSAKLLNEEMNVLNVLADEVEKTRTRIATTQHYQSGDINTKWVPSSSQFKVDTLSVGKLQDYFTLLPGDREHAVFEFLQGNLRTADYISSFKFLDMQIIQMAGLSPSSFGYEKDAYMNEANVDVSKNNSEMTIEAIKTQIEPQLNKLFENVVKAQKAYNIQVNTLPADLVWDYGANEKFDDMKKIQVLNRIQSVSSVPYSVKSKIVFPIIQKLIDDDYDEDKVKMFEEYLEEYNKENEKIKIEYGEI